MVGTILIVDDHDQVRQSLRAWLEILLPDYEIAEATSGEEAVTLVTRKPPALIIMDISLPGMNGIETTRQIKALAPETQIAMLTIHDDAAHRSEAEAAGAGAYLPKRTMSNGLLPAIQRLLGQRDSGTISPSSAPE